jgi:nucleoside-diphosphate-sugar epimerase
MKKTILSPTDRFLVLGASGWFGQTFLRLVQPQAQILATSSTKRDEFATWNAESFRDYKPTVVVNFAFLTSEKVENEGFETFIATNELLTEQFLEASNFPTVRAALTVSSGAAVAFPLDMATNPYGVLKKREEEAALELVTERRSVVVARAWSVSGPLVRRPRAYAFSDMVMQASEGRVLVSSDRPTYRRYVSAQDFLAVCLESSMMGRSGVIDSGGEFIEMLELAHLIAMRVNPAAIIERVTQVSDQPSIYASDGTSWMRACHDLGFTHAALEEQVDAVARGILG